MGIQETVTGLGTEQLFALQRALNEEAGSRGLALPIGGAAMAQVGRETDNQPPHQTEEPVQLAMIGLGRMGANLGKRAVRGGHLVTGYDKSREATQAFGGLGDGFSSARSIREAVDSMENPVVWIMLPSGEITNQAINTVARYMVKSGKPGTIIDGGNSWYVDDMKRSKRLAKHGIDLIDCGTSGGVWGLERGYSLMIGGKEVAVSKLGELWKTLSPGVLAASRTPGREGEPSPAEWGYLLAGANGAGHLIKMIHNGIEYGMMSALAEGLGLIKHIDEIDGDTEGAGARKELTAGSNDLQYFEGLDLADIGEVAEVWRRGSVVGSWLVDLTAAGLAEGPDALEEFPSWVSDSGEGRWTLEAAIKAGYPVPTLSASLNERFSSRNDQMVMQLLNVMREGFGRHISAQKASASV